MDLDSALPYVIKYIKNFFTFQPLSLSDTDEFCGQLAHIILELEMSDWVGIDLELMWNILPQSVLRGLSNGEATYYLTLMSSAVNLIKSGPINLMPLVRNILHTIWQNKLR